MTRYSGLRAHGTCARGLAALILSAALAGCASDPTHLPLGATRDQVLQSLGAPTGRYALDGGRERLQYSSAPAGSRVSNIDLDAQGRVVSIRQELDESLFASTIQPGAWREADILYTYGRPAEITRVTSFAGTVWSWRYLQMNARRFLYIYVDPSGRVVRYHVGDDLTIDRVERRRW
jgi:hypothetical protein